MKALSQITLAHVAERARVSLVTASRALRAGQVVADETRERVLAAAAALGYSPNLLARGLAQNRTTTIGVVIQELANPFFAPVVSGIETVAAKHRYLVIIGQSNGDEQVERRYIAQFQQIRAAGIILTPVATEIEHLALAKSSGTPVVLLTRTWDGDYVTADNARGGRFVAQHFLERGYRKIGVVHTRDPNNTAIQARVRGFRKALSASGVSIPQMWQWRTEWTSIEDGVRAADALLATPKRPRALFVTTDRQAIGIVRRLLDRGIRIPEDLSVVGYDNISYAESARVPLTTVALPIRNMGELAAEILFERLLGTEDGPRQIVLSPALVVRASSP